MSTSTSSAHAVPPAVLLPLIPCPICGERIITYVAQRGEFPGTRFYKCRRHGNGECRFYEWQSVYAERFPAHVIAAIVAAARPAAPAHNHLAAAAAPTAAASLVLAANHDADGQPTTDATDAHSASQQHGPATPAALPPPRALSARSILSDICQAQLPVANLLLTVVNLMASVCVLALVLAIFVRVYSE